MNNQQSNQLEIDRVRFDRWDAWRIRRGSHEIIVLSEVGPRIISYRVNDSENLLFYDKHDEISRGDWKFYGGSRFWVGPETESSYHPENSPCETTIVDNCLIVRSAIEPSGLQRSMTIRPARLHAGFAFDYQLTNRGEMLARGSIWILTCLCSPGRVVVPWAEGGREWQTQMIRFWRRWSQYGSNVASPQWKLDNGLLEIEPTGELGKIGLYSQWGMIIFHVGGGSYVKYAPVQPEGSYPDGGCNLEICTTQRFIELETLSPEKLLTPGTGLSHTEEWLFIERPADAMAWPDVAAKLGIAGPGEH